jgi:preprotein translocase subunit SecD
VRRSALFLLCVGVALLPACGGSRHAATTQRPPADLRIYDPAGHVPVEVTDRDVVASSVKTWRGAGTTNINFELTPRGQRRLLRLTRSLARRGATLHRVQHFAIAVRGRVYSRPYIDYRLTPDGVDAKTGLEIANLRPSEAKRVADALRGAHG